MAFQVDDAGAAYARALSLGAKPAATSVGPMEMNIPAIEGIGGSQIYLVDRRSNASIYDIDFVFAGPAMPGAPDGGLETIDHLTHNVHRGQMDTWAGYYEKLFNFREVRYFDIEGKLTGLKSRAMTSPDGNIRIPINESADDKSQIEEYLHQYQGEGIQHIALATDDIYATVDALRDRGVKFQSAPPDSYYEMLTQRVGPHGEDVDELHKRGILMDGARDQGLLLQIFTENMIGPIFFEIIQRKGNEGFGEGNFKALFESIERDRNSPRRAEGITAQRVSPMVKRDIPVSRVEGKSSRQAHADLPEGTYERELGRDGFFGPATHMYHRRPPTGWTHWEGPLRPRAFDLGALPKSASSPWSAADVLSNANVRLRYWRADKGMDRLARNSDGDELLFLHSGSADLFCDYGHLALVAGDYVILPRGTMWRLSHGAPIETLLIEATGDSYGLPDKGLVGKHAIFDPAILDTPKLDEAFEAQSRAPREWQVDVKRRGAISTVTYPYNPLDAVGWHGDLAPVRLNVRDIRPIMSHRYHLPPSAHTTFLARRFVVCTFVPRPFETDPGAIKVPFFHNNDDFDEVIFYHAGDFFSRDNIKPGMMTFHPCGFTHGRIPKR